MDHNPNMVAKTRAFTSPMETNCDHFLLSFTMNSATINSIQCEKMRIHEFRNAAIYPDIVSTLCIRLLMRCESVRV